MVTMHFDNKIHNAGIDIMTSGCKRGTSRIHLLASIAMKTVAT